MMTAQDRYEQITEELSKFGYNVSTKYSKEAKYIQFVRKVFKGQDTHIVALENHKDDFDEPKDWLIFSYLTNSTRDYWGHWIDEPYALEQKELKLFDSLIDVIEELYPS